MSDDRVYNGALRAWERATHVADSARREVEKQRDAFKERNHHAMDLARLAPVSLRADCNRIDHAVEDLSSALFAMETGLEAIAEHNCEYSDNCPPFGSNHGQCTGCVAREWLAKARIPREEQETPVADTPVIDSDMRDFLDAALLRADVATAKFGPHPSVEFACCRVVEEVGELAQAATSNSKGRDINRRASIREEALDAVAMVLRLLREFPDGRARDSDGAFCTNASCAMCKAGEPCH